MTSTGKRRCENVERIDIFLGGRDFLDVLFDSRNDKAAQTDDDAVSRPGSHASVCALVAPLTQTEVYVRSGRCVSFC